MKRFITALLAMTVCVGMTTGVFAHDYAMSFLFGGTNAQYVNCVQNSNGVLDSVSPDYFEINSDGSLKLAAIDPQFIDTMHSKGLQVIPFVTNHWDREVGNAALNNTEVLTMQIAQAVFDHKLDGVNIDIENINETRKDDYTAFVASLRGKIPGKVLSVSVAANPYNWQTGWHGSYDYGRLADNSDYLLVMGYDESYYGSKPGPVASAVFTEKSIEYALKHTTPNKIVLGIPFFGRYWKQGEEVGGHGLTVMDVNNLIKHYTTSKTFHDDKQSARVMLSLTADDTLPKVWGGRTLDTGVYEIWYDDMQSTAYKLSLVNRYKLRGSGSWALGQNTEDMWSSYAQHKAGTAAMSTPAPTATPSPTPPPSPTPTPSPSPTPTPAPTTTPATASPTPAATPGVTHHNRPHGKPRTNATHPNSAPAANKIMSKAARSAVDKGWLNEADYDEYRYVTRGEAITMIMKMAALLPDVDSNLNDFSDTTSHKNRNYIHKARSYGIITGDRGNRFYPDRAISRQDLIMYLDRVFNLPDTVNFEHGMAKDLHKRNNAERYYAVQKYLAHEIVRVDSNGYFHPNRAVTMGELARMAHKLDGCGLKELRVIQKEGERQRHRILEPR